MRSLTLLARTIGKAAGKKPEGRCTGIAVVPPNVIDSNDEEIVFLASERQLRDGGVEVQILRAVSTDSVDENTVSRDTIKVELRHHCCKKQHSTRQAIATFQAPPEPPFEINDGKHIVNFQYHTELNALVVILAGGDIITLEIDADFNVDVVGSVEAGIRAAEWSPDEELLVIITGEDKIVEMIKTFDVLTELPLITLDFGEEKPVDVGWGAQSTQFHGSIGKTGRDALAGLPAASGLSQPGTSSPDTLDSSIKRHTDACRISWRGDGAFFVVSAAASGSKHSSSERRLRFYSRVAILQSTSESTPGLEDATAWQPSGSIIACSALESKQIIFFERNGLRRYEFDLRQPSPSYVRRLAWNLDSSVLAVWLEQQGSLDAAPRHVVQLWTRNNYHWYLKQSIPCRGSGLELMQWSQEDPLKLYLIYESDVDKHDLAWSIYRSHRPTPNDDGAVAVVDGEQILLTVFRHQNVPPPMSSLVLQIPDGSTPLHIAFDANSDALAALMPNGAVHIFSWAFAKGNKSSQTYLGCLSHIDGHRPRSISLRSSDDGRLQIIRLCDNATGSDSSLHFDSTPINGTMEDTAPSVVRLDYPAISLIQSEDGLCIQAADGRILDDVGDRHFSFPKPCPDWLMLSNNQAIGLSRSGELYFNDTKLASSVTSFALTEVYLIYTTLTHEMRFMAIRLLGQTDSSQQTFSHVMKVPTDQTDANATAKGMTRRVERGSRIVTVVPSSMTVIVQLPRGNLESICPRPLVLYAVQLDLERKRYRDAFIACRRHRIDLNVICDHDLQSFTNEVELFVEQLPEPDYLNLFMSGLKDDNVFDGLYAGLAAKSAVFAANGAIAAKTGLVCAALRSVLQLLDQVTYATCLVTSFACQRLPDYEAALGIIKRIKGIDKATGYDTVKFLIYLSDTDKLYDVALGMYDFELVLAVAQQSQKDPREYLPFLRELRKLPEAYQRFRIDDHLRRHTKALSSIVIAGDDRFEEALAYISQHELYDEAVSLYKGRAAQLKIVLERRGDWLSGDNRYPEAALSYCFADCQRKAIGAYQRALQWREALDMAMQSDLDFSEIDAMAREMSTVLRDRARHAEAAQILVDYAHDISEAVTTLCEGTQFAEALRLSALHVDQREQLISDLVLPAVISFQDRLVEDAAELEEQIEKQATRLDELRQKRERDADEYYKDFLPNGPDALDNVDIQTEGGMSAATTQFTRYTVAALSTRASVKTGKTGRASRKQMRKAISGAKGSVYEESYLLGSLSRTVTADGKLSQIVSSTASLLRVMARLKVDEVVAVDATVDLTALACDLEDAIKSLVDKTRASVDDVWQKLGESKVLDLEAALLAEAAGNANAVDVLTRPAKPIMADFGHWQVPLIRLVV